MLATCMKLQMRINQGNVSQCPIVEKNHIADATRFFDLLRDSD